MGKPEMCTGEYDLYPDEQKNMKAGTQKYGFGGSAVTNKKIIWSSEAKSNVTFCII